MTARTSPAPAAHHLQPAPGRRRAIWVWGIALLALFISLFLWFLWQFNRLDESPLSAHDAAPASQDPQVLARGAYLARAGSCLACHSRPDGAPWSGGRAIDTPFGALYSSNLTPDTATGLGAWTRAEFWRALHNGRSRDGRLLYPAFPYTHYSLVTRDDADALYSYLHSLKPVHYTPPAHTLRFPYNTQLALATWRALFFRPATWQAQPNQSAEWNRGAYLVQGLGHCGACHSPRNALGATIHHTFEGGLLHSHGQQWYAPSLRAANEASLANWPQADAIALLQTGRAPQATVSGPMAEVVLHSLQHLHDTDLHAMLTYLNSLPGTTASAASQPDLNRPRPSGALLTQGEQLYTQHCADCHGTQGQGRNQNNGQKAFPALAGNRSVLLKNTHNLVQTLRHGGYPPATAGNPRPYGMPPFLQQLSRDEMAAVLSYIRNAWGNQADPVDALDLHRIH